MFKIVIPLTKTMATPPPAPAGKAMGSGVDIIAGAEADDELLPSAAEELARKLEEARGLAQKDPKVVANIIKDWTNANGS